MRKILLSINAKIFLVVMAAILCNGFYTQAQDDSCMASYYWLTDVNDPLLIHFNFNGTVPPNSFTFLGSWDFGDGNVSADSCPDHQYSQPGNYTVCLVFSICIGGGLSCHDDTCRNITVGNIQSVANPDGALHTFYSYPNPAQTKFYVRTDAVNKDIEIKVTGIDGKEMLNTLLRDENTPIDISSFSNGIYFIEASDGKQTLKRKMTVQK